MFCTTCAKPCLDHAVVCPNCGCPPRSLQGTFCNACGSPVPPQAAVCPNCHAAKINPNAFNITIPPIPGLGNNQPKSRTAAGLLQLVALLGISGIGRLYLGYTTIGILQLILGFCGIGIIWSVIDGILILTGSVPTDAAGAPLQN